MFRVALAPLLDAELQVIVVFLGEDRAFVFVKLGAARGVGQDRMLDDVLMDGLDERIVGDGLNEDRAVVVAWASPSRPPAARGGGPSAASGGGCPEWT